MTKTLSESVYITDNNDNTFVVVEGEETPAGKLRLVNVETGKMLDFVFSTIPELLHSNDSLVKHIYRW
ncbi:hypothetical protein [Pseudobutyrivibrio sp.]